MLSLKAKITAAKCSILASHFFFSKASFFFSALTPSNSRIADLLRMSRRTLQNWIHLFEKEGVSGLKKFNYKGQRSKLHQHSETIEEHFRKNPPKSIRDACLTIEKLTGLKRGETPVRAFLKAMGMSLRKTGAIPGKADPVAQEEKNARANTGRCPSR